MLKKLFSDQVNGFWRFHCETQILACKTLFQAVDKLEFVKRNLNSKNILVLSDQGVESTGVVDQLFFGLSVDVSLLSAECEISPINAAIEAGKKGKVDLIVAVGGGSVLDAAKIVAAAIPNALAPEDLWKVQNLPVQPVMLLAIPTTFGTGSECNMITHLKMDNVKRSLNREWLTPPFALLVAEIAETVPSKLRYLAALDAWLHAVEALTLRNEVSPIQQGILKEAIQLLDSNFKSYVNTPDKENSFAIASASSMAGLALNNSRTGLAHALATPFAECMGLPHTESLLPFILPSLRYNWQNIASSFPDESLIKFEQRIKANYLFNAGAIMNNWHFTINAKDVDVMVKTCLDDSVLKKENPMPIEPEGFTELYKVALAQWLI